MDEVVDERSYFVLFVLVSKSFATRGGTLQSKRITGGAKYNSDLQEKKTLNVNRLGQGVSVTTQALL